MKVTVERIEPKDEEELIVRCYDPGAAWVSSVTEAASDHRTICGWQEDTMHRLRLTEIFYFEVVDDRSFLYTQAAVFEAKEKLYEFERLCAGSTLFRCSKSMILNAEKIDYVRPSLSGRFEAVLLPLAHFWGFWHGGTDILVYAGFILLAKALWHLVDYGLNAKTAAQINERIRKNRLEKRN